VASSIKDGEWGCCNVCTSGLAIIVRSDQERRRDCHDATYSADEQRVVDPMHFLFGMARGVRDSRSGNGASSSSPGWMSLHEAEGADDSEWPVISLQDFQQMMAGMPQGEQQKLMVMLEEMQLKEQVTMYNSLVERCVCRCPGALS
jgi:hypothetical protein